MGLMNKIMSGYSKRQIRRLEKTVRKIEDLADKYSAMSEEEMRAQTALAH